MHKAAREVKHMDGRDTKLPFTSCIECSVPQITVLKLAFWTSSIVPDCLNDKIVKETNTTFQKLDLLPSSGKITKGG
jgi:hypothetical protein